MMSLLSDISHERFLFYSIQMFGTFNLKDELPCSLESIDLKKFLNEILLLLYY